MGRRKTLNFANDEERKAYNRQMNKCSCGYHNKFRPNHICEEFLKKTYRVYDIKTKSCFRVRYLDETTKKRKAIVRSYAKKDKATAYNALLNAMHKLNIFPKLGSDAP